MNQYRIERSESFFGRTTPRVEWKVIHVASGKLERVCATRRAAVEWAATCERIDAAKKIGA